MSPILTAAEMRAAEARAVAGGTSLDSLMARAGAAVAEAAWRYAGGAPTLILCGPGNNGGDGYVAARLLRARGVAVRVAASASPRTDLATAACAAWDGPVETLDEARPAALLIDALFGTGLTRPLDAAVAKPLARLAEAAALRLAVDVPSGVGSDDGAVLGDVLRFDLTLALGARKPAHLLQPAASQCGRVAVADIGVVADARTTLIDRPSLPAPGPADHKYSRGMVAVVGGAMPGAASLAAEAAQRAGAGYVLLAGEAAGGPHALVRRGWSAALLDDARIGAVVVGPGLGRDAAARERLAAALGSGRSLVIDADALHLLKRHLPLAVPAVLTPHAGEFAALFGDLPGSKLDRARAAARAAGAVVILKGADSVVAAPDGHAAIAPPAPGWLASAGTGDVLAGTVAAMLAGGLPPFEAAQAALWLHGEAARIAGLALIADDLLPALSTARGACS